MYVTIFSANFSAIVLVIAMGELMGKVVYKDPTGFTCKNHFREGRHKI